MSESKNLQWLTKPEIPRKTKKCEVMQQCLPPLGAGLAHPLKYRSIFPK